MTCTHRGTDVLRPKASSHNKLHFMGKSEGKRYGEFYAKSSWSIIFLPPPKHVVHSPINLLYTNNIYMYLVVRFLHLAIICLKNATSIVCPQKMVSS